MGHGGIEWDSYKFDKRLQSPENLFFSYIVINGQLTCGLKKKSGSLRSFALAPPPPLAVRFLDLVASGL